MSDLSRLTARQRQVFDAIADYIDEHGYPPTLREIGDAVGIRSTNGVYGHLAALEKKGAIERSEGIPRGMRIIGERQ